MRQDQIGRKRDNRILDPNSAHTRPGGANSEKKLQKNSKNQRTTFRQYFQPNRDETGREREKRILDPNSAHTRPEGENSEKKKKSKKIKKQLAGVIFSQNGMRLAEKKRKEFQTRNPLIVDPGEKIPSKNRKKFKK